MMRCGQSLIEILVGTALGALLVATGAALVVPALQTNTALTEIQAQAQLGTEMADNVRAWAAGNWPAVLALATTSANTYYLNTATSPFYVVGAGQAAAVLGQPNFTSGVAATTPAGLNCGYYCILNKGETNSAYDTVNNRLFVPDGGNNRVLVYNLASGSSFINGMSASAVIGQPTFYSSTTGTTAQNFNLPSTVAYDSANQRLFVGDQQNGRVLVFNVAPGFASTGLSASYVLGASGFTSVGNLGQITGLAYDPNYQRLFVASFNYNSVVVFNVAPGVITNGEATSAVLSSSGASPASSATSQNGLYYPAGIAYDSANNRLFVADSQNARVMVFNVPQGFASGENAGAVIGQADFVSSVSATTQNGLSIPLSVAFDAANQRLFVGDAYSNNRVMVFNAAPGVLPQFAASAVAVIGQPDFTTNTCGGAQQSATCYASGLAYDSANQRLFIGDDYNRVQGFGAAQNASGSITGAEGVMVNGVSYTRYFYVNDVYRDASGNPTSTTAGNFYDPSTKQITVIVQAASSSAPLVPYTFYLTRNANNVFSQTNWSGGAGQNTPLTTATATYYTNVNVNVNLNGTLQLLGAPGGTCQS